MGQQDDNPSDHASQFEAVKVSITQDKNGYVLRLMIHPDEVPERVLRDFVGARYMVAMVRLNDQNEAIPDPQVERGKKAVTMAAMLCDTPDFQTWTVERGWTDAIATEKAAEGLRKVLGIASRSELRTNEKAREKFFKIVSAFEDWMREK